MYIAVVLVIAVLISTPVYAGGNVEFQEQVCDGRMTPQMSAYVSQPITGNFGWSAFLLSSTGWSEGYVGPTYSPCKFAQISTSVGIESHPQQTRFAASLWVGRGPYSGVLINEQGGSGSWTKIVAKKTVMATTPVGQVTVGLHHQSFLGIGPTIELAPKAFVVWASVLVEDGKTTVVQAIMLKF
jgi:hypothetical protein